MCIADIEERCNTHHHCIDSETQSQCEKAKKAILSDIDSDDLGELSERCAVDSVDDQVLQPLLQKRGEEAVQSLEDIDLLIGEYKKISGNELKVKKSSHDSFCLYVCKGHAKCQHQIFGGKQPDGMFAVKRIVLQHHGHPMSLLSVASMPRTKSSRNASQDNDDNDDTSYEDSTNDEESGSRSDEGNDD